MVSDDTPIATRSDSIVKFEKQFSLKKSFPGLYASLRAIWQKVGLLRHFLEIKIRLWVKAQQQFFQAKQAPGTLQRRSCMVGKAGPLPICMVRAQLSIQTATKLVHISVSEETNAMLATARGTNTLSSDQALSWRLVCLGNKGWTRHPCLLQECSWTNLGPKTSIPPLGCRNLWCGVPIQMEAFSLRRQLLPPPNTRSGSWPATQNSALILWLEFSAKKRGRFDQTRKLGSMQQPCQFQNFDLH